MNKLSQSVLFQNSKTQIIQVMNNYRRRFFTFLLEPIASSIELPPPTNAQSTFIVFPRSSVPCRAFIASCASDLYAYSIKA
mmetsp:Transcript_8666/g.10936  ORF Transcript_8666/g.10936 Transcript_8666/m.10936 type:complete len:81 (+) Transcript_8666:61-303(+)